MRFNILSDAWWESKVDKALDELSEFGFREYFQGKSYGIGLNGVTVFFICNDPEYNQKRRVSHSKKESKIYMDIMLDLPTMVTASHEERKQIIVQRLFDEVPQVVSRYKLPDFDEEAFIADLRSWIKGIGWI